MRADERRKILVLDGDMVPALTIARSLFRKGCVITTASHVPRPLAEFSRCVDTVVKCPNPLLHQSEYLDWLEDYTRKYEYQLLIPVTERSLVPISAHRTRFSHVRIAMPSANSLELVLDKGLTVQLAQQVNVPTPASVLIQSSADLDSGLDSLSYPVVVKPARSLGNTAAGMSQLRVSYAFDEGELRSTCEHGLAFGPVLLQEYFAGDGVGVELIASKGEIIYAFQHLRLHEVPITGGGSSLRMSVALEPELLAAARRLIRELVWDGVAMVEFKWNSNTRTYTLMEINGRFWGSLPLAAVAGADFPAMLLDLELGTKGSPMQPYREGILCRKLSSDLHWYEAVLRGGASSQTFKPPGGWETFKALGRLFSRRHYYDVQSLSDPLPGLVDIARIVNSYIRRIASLVEQTFFLWSQRRRWARGDVAKAIRKGNSLLFVCYGNINRSALAEALVRESATSASYEVVSAGLHRTAQRPADPVMVTVARERGICLGASRSKVLTQEMLETSDAIFVMELQHVDALREMDSSCLAKTWLLGANASGETDGEIADPYGKPRGAYEACFRQISTAVQCIERHLLPK